MPLDDNFFLLIMWQLFSIGKGSIDSQSFFFEEDRLAFIRMTISYQNCTIFIISMTQALYCPLAPDVLLISHIQPHSAMENIDTAAGLNALSLLQSLLKTQVLLFVYDSQVVIYNIVEENIAISRSLSQGSFTNWTLVKIEKVIFKASLAEDMPTVSLSSIAKIITTVLTMNFQKCVNILLDVRWIFGGFLHPLVELIVC